MADPLHRNAAHDSRLTLVSSSKVPVDVQHTARTVYCRLVRDRVVPLLASLAALQACEIGAGAANRLEVRNVCRPEGTRETQLVVAGHDSLLCCPCIEVC